jgi:hypothetical protein
MNNFNVVLAAIRDCCVEINVPNSDCLEHVKQRLDANYHEHLDFYLSFLVDLGLILYDPKEGSVTLTEKGRGIKQLFS